MNYKITKNKDGNFVFLFEGVEYTHAVYGGDNKTPLYFYKVLGDVFNYNVVCLRLDADCKNFPYSVRVDVALFNKIVPIKKPKPFFHDFKEDDKILVRDSDSQGWRKRHFHSLDVDGRPRVYSRGTTSFSNDDGYTTGWNQAKHPETGEEWVYQNY